MTRFLVASVVSSLAMLFIPACSATPPDQGNFAEDSQLQPASGPHVPRVLVFPFAPTGSVGAYDWIGRGIQQSLLADLSRSHSAEIVFPATQPSAGPVNPMAVAGAAGANVVVVGTYQVNEGQVRITGEAFDVLSGRNLGGIKATGPATDLFKLEDDLHDQLARVLPSVYETNAQTGNNPAARVTPPAAAGEPAELPMPAPSYADNGAATQGASPMQVIRPDDTAADSSPTPTTTYNYYNMVPPTTSTPDDYSYSDPYYYPASYYAGYPYYYGGYPYYYGAWPAYGFVGIGFYPGFSYGRYYGYPGRYYWGGRWVYTGGYRGGMRPGYVGGGFRGGFGGGGFHGGGFVGGGFHGGGGGMMVGGHR